MTTPDTKWIEEALKAPHTQRHIKEIAEKPATVDIKGLCQMGAISRRIRDKYGDGDE